MKKLFLLILIGLFSINSNSQEVVVDTIKGTPGSIGEPILTGIDCRKKTKDLKKAKKFAKTITADELKEHLYIYASDEFEGRNTGAEGQKKL